MVKQQEILVFKGKLEMERLKKCTFIQEQYKCKKIFHHITSNLAINFQHLNNNLKTFSKHKSKIFKGNRKMLTQVKVGCITEGKNS